MRHLTVEHCLSSLARQSLDEMWRVKEIAQDAIPIDATVELIKEMHNAAD